MKLKREELEDGIIKYTWWGKKLLIYGTVLVDMNGIPKTVEIDVKRNFNLMFIEILKDLSLRGVYQLVVDELIEKNNYTRYSGKEKTITIIPGPVLETGVSKYLTLELPDVLRLEKREEADKIYFKYIRKLVTVATAVYEEELKEVRGEYIEEFLKAIELQYGIKEN